MIPSILSFWRYLLASTLWFLAATVLAEARSSVPAWIFYVNETRPVGEEAAAYNTLEQWLKTSPDADLRKFADRIKDDQTHFAEASDREISNLSLLRIKSTQTKIPLFVVNNALAREGVYLYWAENSTTAERRKLRRNTKEAHAVLRSNPLASISFFQNFLQDVRIQLNPERHIVLVTKSHGNAEMAMMPFLRLWPENISSSEMRAIIKQGLLAKDANQILPHGAHRLGVTKRQYMDAVAKSGLHLDIVLMESCFGGPPSANDNFELPENVSELYASYQEGTAYEKIDYKKVFYTLEHGAPLATAFALELKTKFSRFYRKTSWLGFSP